MPRRYLNRLTATQVKTLTKPGKYADGNGLSLQITDRNQADGRRIRGKSWLLRYQQSGRAKSMGLGPVDTVSLAEARKLVQAAQVLIQQGIDPKLARDETERTQQREAERAVGIPTFNDASKRLIETKRAEWQNAKSAQQWENTLSTYAHPVIGALKVNEIEHHHVLAILQPIWKTKTETAMRLRGRIEEILTWATHLGYRDGDNPAIWRGRLSYELPNPSRVRTVRHHPALPYAELPQFMAELYRRDQTAASHALALGILTALRAGEVRKARVGEFRLDEEVPVWEIPAERMKMKKPHRVPLSTQAIAIIVPRLNGHGDALVFESNRTGRPISENATRMLLKAMDRLDITTHGFRSTFRDWAAERTHSALEVIELSLAHKVKSSVEAAYWRSDIVEKRWTLMKLWADFATSKVADEESVEDKIAQLVDDEAYAGSMN